MSKTSPAAASGVSHVRTCTSGGTTRPTPASPSATPAKMRKPAGISNTYRMPLWSLPGDGRSSTVAWNTKKAPNKTCSTHSATFIYCLPAAEPLARRLVGASVKPTIVSVLTMRKPDIRPHAPLTHGDLTVDASGYLYDPAMRRAVVESGGAASVEVFEALGALRLAAKRIHDAMERFAEGHGLSESRLRVQKGLW